MDELTEIAKQLPFTEHGAPRLALLKKAYKIADQENLTDYQIDMRLDYIDEATFYDDIMLIYVLFPEVLKLHDKQVEEKGHCAMTYRVMWEYKWLLEHAVEFYQISIGQFEAICTDFQERCQHLAYSMKTSYQYQFMFYMYCNEEKAQEAYKHFLKEKRGVLSDCVACERDMQVRYLLVTGRMNEAEEAAHDLFSGKLHCEEVPNVTYGQFLRSCNQLIASGNTEVLEKASAYCREIRASVVREKIGTGYIGDILLYYSLTDTAKALPFYKKYWHYFEKNKNPMQQFYFALAACHFFSGMKGKKKFHMKLPTDFPFYQENDQYDVNELTSYYNQHATDIMQKLDQRNGSSYFSDVYESVLGKRQEQ